MKVTAVDAGGAVFGGPRLVAIAGPCVIESAESSLRHAERLAATLYRRNRIAERHRHRYEVNNHYRAALEKAGFKATGTSPDDSLVEIMELPSHPWFLGCQFHPEFKSKPLEPHPLFAAFIGAALEHKKKKLRPASEPHRAQAVAVAPHVTA